MLKDVLDRVAIQLPRYFPLLCAILARPVREVSHRARDENGLEQAVLFWAVSLLFRLVTRYIAFHAQVDQVVFFVGNLVASSVTLTVVSLAFWSCWRLFGASAPLASHLAAVALVWGALMPITAVLNAVAIGSTRLMSDGAYEWLRTNASGCLGERTFALPEIIEGPLTTGTGLLAFALYSTIVLISVLICAAYYVAFLRILRALDPMPPARFAVVATLSSAAALIAGALGAGFYLTLVEGIGLCRP